MNELYISINDTLDVQEYYSHDALLQAFNHTLRAVETRLEMGLALPYYPFSKKFGLSEWYKTPKTLDIYITDTQEARQLNLDARGKDYATNILSYPSDLPQELLGLVDELPLGELIICHEVISSEALTQHKTHIWHLTHLVVHGVLHLLGFDHELGQAEQDEMEALEIEILYELGFANPYETDGDDLA